MSTSRVPLTLKSFTSKFRMNKLALYSSTAVVLGSVGFYRYHSTQPTVIASQNNKMEVSSYSANELFHDHASSANNNKRFQRITIPSGKATIINYNPIDQHNNLRHILITVEGEGEVHYSPNTSTTTTTTTTTTTNEKIIYGTDNTIIHKKLKLGSSVGIPSTNWHQIINKHESKDLVLVVTSVPDQESKKQTENPPQYIL